MTDRSGVPESGDDGARAYERESGTGIPRWAKVTGLVALLLALLIVIVMLIGGGEHGPSRHSGSAGVPAATASNVVQ